MSIGEVVFTFHLDRPRKLYFNNNTFTKFEEASGKRFFQLFAEIITELGGKPKEEITDLDIASAVPMSDVQILVWAACHEYDERDEPSWPLTMGAVGRYIGLGNIAELLQQLVAAVQSANPRVKDMPPGLAKEAEASADRPTTGSPPPKNETTGGPPSTISDQSVLDGLTHKSEDSPPDDSSNS